MKRSAGRKCVSIIIPTLNEERNLKALLGSLRMQLQKNDEIIIVDSHSTDRTRNVARRYGCRVMTVPAEGIAAAKNAGAKAARNSTIAFLDADSTVGDGWLDGLKGHLLHGRAASAVAGIDLYSSDSAARERVYNIYSASVFHLARAIYALGGRPWLPANNCAMRRSLFLKIGGFSNVVCEDAELMRRWPTDARVLYDNGIRVTLSDRRFRKNGFLRTLLVWTAGDIRAWRGAGTDAKNYGRV